MYLEASQYHYYFRHMPGIHQGTVEWKDEMKIPEVISIPQRMIMSSLLIKQPGFTPVKSAMNMPDEYPIFAGNDAWILLNRAIGQRFFNLCRKMFH